MAEEINKSEVIIPSSYDEVVFDATQDMFMMVKYMMESPRIPITPEEQESGWRKWTGPDGKERTFAVGWRLEQTRREDEARVEAEMAACPYVACVCGWHE